MSTTISKDYLLADAAKGDCGKWVWAVTYPQDILSVSRQNLELHASVSAVSEDGETPFPGAKKTDLDFNTWTSARLHAEFCFWAVLLLP